MKKEEIARERELFQKNWKEGNRSNADLEELYQLH